MLVVVIVRPDACTPYGQKFETPADTVSAPLGQGQSVCIVLARADAVLTLAPALTDPPMVAAIPSPATDSRSSRWVTGRRHRLGQFGVGANNRDFNRKRLAPRFDVFLCTKQFEARGSLRST